MPARRPRAESSSPASLPGVMEARRRRRRRRGSRRSRKRSDNANQEEVRSQSSGVSSRSRSPSAEPEQPASAKSPRSCPLGNVNPYINFVASSKGLYSGRSFRSMSKDMAARWRALPESEREPFIVQARRSQAEIAKAAARRVIPEARRRRRRRRRSGSRRR